ncbi:hypothetical protein Q8A73_004000 [Channa argus]|nr:hypothetical protein Q8A73_004000 [Channa argus]
MVDTGATSHIINDIRKLINFDSSFQPGSHSVELADRTRCSGIAEKRGTAVIYLLDNAGKQHRAQLRDTLYVPSYPQDIFSVVKATNGGATITFKREDNHLITKDGSSSMENDDNKHLHLLIRQYKFTLYGSFVLNFLLVTGLLCSLIWLKKKKNCSRQVTHPSPNNTGTLDSQQSGTRIRPAAQIQLTHFI